MQKRMFNNKKAQQSNWFMIVLILSLVVLVVVGLAVSGVFGKISNLFGKVNDLEVAVQACKMYASQDLKTSYCNEFQKVEIFGKTQYANCEFIAKNAKIEKTLDCEWKTLENGENEKEVLIKSFCKNKDIDSEVVNGFTCKEEEGTWSLSEAR